MQTTNNFETWSASSPVWTATTNNYAPGLFERAKNNVIVTIDAFGGKQRILSRP